MQTTYQHIETSRLIPYVRNARTHSEAQVAQIASSIKEFGFLAPVVIDADYGIMAGHGRILAARMLGLETVPCVRADHLTENQKRAYIIADNRLAETSEWDTEMLAFEMEDLRLDDYDIDLTGFGVDDVPPPSKPLDGMPDLPSGDKEPFQQKTFTLHDEQASVVDDAITLARTSPLADTGLNENSNGNALALICSEWLESRNE